MRNLFAERLGTLLLVRELRRLRKELAGQRVALEGIRQQLQPLVPPPPLAPTAQQADDVEVTYVNDSLSAEMADIELRLTAARGLPPTEDEILAEYERRRQGTG